MRFCEQGEDDTNSGQVIPVSTKQGKPQVLGSEAEDDRIFSQKKGKRGLLCVI